MIKIKSISLLPNIQSSTSQTTKVQKVHPKRINSQALNKYYKPSSFYKSSKTINSYLQSKSSKYKIPSNNLPKLKHTSNQSRNLSKSKHSHNSSAYIPETYNAPINSASVATFAECKPQVGFFLFPKKTPKNIKHMRKKEKKDLLVSSWISESSPFLFNIPALEIN